MPGDWYVCYIDVQSSPDHRRANSLVRSGVRKAAVTRISRAINLKDYVFMSDSLRERQIAQFLWVEGSLSTMERLSLQSFLNNGYEVHLYHYGDIVGAPEGVVMKDGNDILSSDNLFEATGLARSSYTAFSDYFRYHLLFKKGGWWFDTDFVSLKLLPQPTELLFASTWEGASGSKAVGCAMWTRPGDERFRWLITECEKLVKVEPVLFIETGPKLVQRLVAEHGLERYVAPWWEFCPYPWRMIQRLLHDSFGDWCFDQLRLVKQLLHEVYDSSFKAGRVRSGTRALHLHNEIWKQNGFDKDKEYFRWCLWERLKRRHLTDACN